VKAHCGGEVCLIRYADDFVCGFEHEYDAQRFYKALGLRLEKYGLQLAAAKTRILRFDRSDGPGTTRFDFLGFEYFWGPDRAGVPRVQRRTSRKKLRNSLATFTRFRRVTRWIL
jgi:RNA-directed DNA polymerase